MRDSGERLFFNGVSETLPSGDSLVYGGRGEVLGPGTGKHADGEFLVLHFAGNTEPVPCFLHQLSRLPLPSLNRLYKLPNGGGGRRASR